MAIDFRRIITFTAALLVLFSFSATTAYASQEPNVLPADFNYVVFDIELGQTLSSNKPDAQFEYPELITTLVGYFAMENLQETGKITAHKSSVSTSGEVILEEGKVYTIQGLINACVVGNANNAADLLVEKMAIEDISSFLNDFAAENSLTNTYFVTENAFTTPTDLAKIIKLLLENVDFKTLFCATYVSGPSGEIITCSNEIVFENTEDLLGGNFSKSTAIFVKFNKDVQLITVVNTVNEKSYLEVEKYLENLAESIFEKKPLVKSGEIVTSVKINEKGTREVRYVAHDTINVYMPKDGTPIIGAVTFSYNEGFSEEDLKLPISKGQCSGTVTYTLSDGTVISLPIYAMTDVHFANSLIDNLRSSVMNYSELYFAVCVLLILFILIGIYKIWLKKV